MRGRFLEAILLWTERKLAGPGRPGTVDGLVAKVERREAPRPTSLGARGSLAARGGYVNPASRVCRLHILAPPAAPPPRAVCEGLAKLGRMAPRERKTCPSFRGACALAQANPESRSGEHRRAQYIWIPGSREERAPE